LLQYFTPHLKEFILHNYVSKWQDFQFCECLENLAHDTMFSCVDFSKNYTLKIQNEIHDMHDLDEEIEASISNEWIAENLCPCDNVTIPTLTDEPFWLLLVNKGPHIVVTSFNDENGNVWTKNVVHIFWY